MEVWVFAPSVFDPRMLLKKFNLLAKETLTTIEPSAKIICRPLRNNFVK